MELHRGICSSPLLRLAAEPRPMAGFAEQKSVSGAVSKLCSGEALDEVGGNADEIAAILSGIAELDAAISFSFTEMLDLSVLGIFNGSSCGLTTYKRQRIDKLTQRIANLMHELTLKRSSLTWGR
eukprot:CAMPEP_0180477876 /NCGR_PEP_ID=MMETSP1036_2-20121128/32489_1 /TAXON_ID=632150 /ORGANISM="Azadinium spinosum, Strain 3D9" /LENGTH=124 /DNA_ID=CAMNT_0022485379 /DNA_START=181 /DNA_END=555 /DNA_ORIENTATION=-